MIPDVLKKTYKKIFKRFIFVILAVFVLYLGVEAGYQGKYYLERWKESRELSQINKSIIAMFKADTYGGQTPEETYNMFIDALKNEDVDLAVKYFVLDPDRRANYWKEFDDLKQEGKMKEYGEKLPAWDKWEQIKDNYNDWTNRAMIEYGQVVTEPVTVYDQYLKKDTIIEPGVYRSSIIFVKSSNNIWKIESL